MHTYILDVLLITHIHILYNTYPYNIHYIIYDDLHSSKYTILSVACTSDRILIISRDIVSDIRDVRPA